MKDEENKEKKSRSSKDVLCPFPLHFFFSFSGGGCVYSASKERVQVADPGNWNLNINGTTSGTPVSGPRSFSRGSVFSAWLKEVVIVK